MASVYTIYSDNTTADKNQYSQNVSQRNNSFVWSRPHVITYRFQEHVQQEPKLNAHSSDIDIIVRHLLLKRIQEGKKLSIQLNGINLLN